ncbi:MAG: nuclear transport factor 2 family protein [Streptosporangiaceae bacterium]|nr:nuclear transport factor 2 family protein [Streptosporangiaceae bacterium]
MTHTKEQIHGFLQRLTAAERDGDVGTLAGLLDDDFVCVGPLGFVLTKPQWLAGYRTGDLVYQALTLEDTSERRYGDTVITISIRTQQATYQGNPAPGGPFRITHIIVRRDSAWLLAGFHISPITSPPPQ